MYINCTKLYFPVYNDTTIVMDSTIGKLINSSQIALFMKYVVIVLMTLKLTLYLR